MKNKGKNEKLISELTKQWYEDYTKKFEYESKLRWKNFEKNITSTNSLQDKSVFKKLSFLLTGLSNYRIYIAPAFATILVLIIANNNFKSNELIQIRDSKQITTSDLYSSGVYIPIKESIAYSSDKSSVVLTANSDKAKIIQLESCRPYQVMPVKKGCPPIIWVSAPT